MSYCRQIKFVQCTKRIRLILLTLAYLAKEPLLIGQFTPNFTFRMTFGFQGTINLPLYDQAG